MIYLDEKKLEMNQSNRINAIENQIRKWLFKSLKIDEL